MEKLLAEYPKTQAVLLTSPTYDGAVSDIRSIARICHAHRVPLIVDEAHGAHLGFHPYFPESALKLGADVVIQSFHKTLPSLTQTAVLHVGRDAPAVSGDLPEQQSVVYFHGSHGPLRGVSEK